MATETADPGNHDGISPEAFRRACGQFATGVTVVTVHKAGADHGVTVNSFTSVSLAPPLILVSLGHRSRTHNLLEVGDHFAVNVLAEAHRKHADRFAGRHGDIQGKFEDIEYHRSVEGLPIIDGALATFVCYLIAVHPMGDHSLFIGQVERIEGSHDGNPLLFFNRSYRTLGQSVAFEPI